MFNRQVRAAFDNLPLVITIHETVLRHTCCTGSFAEDSEVCFLVRITVAVIEAHFVAVEDSRCGLAETIGQLVSFRLAFAREAAPASRFVPFVASAGSIHVDGDQTDVSAAQLGANAVDSAAALGERDVFVFRNQQGRVVATALEFIIDTAGDFARVGPFKETAVGASLSCSFPAVPIVD